MNKKRTIKKSALLLVENKKLLVARSIGKDKFYIPGGKVENGETLKEALVREIKEELSITIEVDSVSKYGVFTAPAHAKSNVNVSLYTYIAKVQGSPSPSHEIEEIKWVTSESRSDLSEASMLVLDSLRHDGFID